MTKPLEYWAVMLGMVIYVATRDAEREALMRRCLKTAASALLALGLSAEAAGRFGVSEPVSVVALMAFGMLGLDIATALIRDRDFIKELIRTKIGGGK